MNKNGVLQTALKLAKDLNKVSLEELISSLRSHEIELNEDEPQKKNKSVALKSNRISESKALQVLEESSAKSFGDEDEMSLLSKRLNQIWKHKQRKFRNSRKPEHRGESSGHRRSSKKEMVCYECNEPG